MNPLPLGGSPGMPPLIAKIEEDSVTVTVRRMHPVHNATQGSRGRGSRQDDVRAKPQCHRAPRSAGGALAVTQSKRLLVLNVKTWSKHAGER